MSFVAVGEFERGVLDLGDFALGKQPHTVDESQICHEPHLISTGIERASKDVRQVTRFKSSDSAVAMSMVGDARARPAASGYNRGWFGGFGDISMDEIRDTVILGSGCAGLTAAIYSARANLKPLVLEGHEPGGQLSITTMVENFPGWPEGIQGPELIENMKKQASRFGAEFKMSHLVSVDLATHPFHLKTSHGDIRTRTLIIASGASARWLGLPSEQALIGHGVSSCATCDGFFFNGHDIAVVGGGDTAMEEALFLTRFATKVYVLHRRESFRASKVMLERAIAHPKIEMMTNTVVEEVLGVEEKSVRGLHVRNVKTNEHSVLPVTGFFLGIGHEPNAKMFHGQIDLDEDGYVVTKNNVHTRVPGVFACGDVQDRHYRQAITAAGSGCMAALEAEKYLEEHGH